MTVATKKKRLEIGPRSNGILLSPSEFDHADFEEGWCYELINGVLIVSEQPFSAEKDPNEQLGYWLRLYQENHPQGACLDKTLPEQTIRVGANRRRADRAIWIGFGRRPRRRERPTIAVEFVSSRKRDRDRDYIAKRQDYMRIRIKEYWIIDRFKRSMTIFSRDGDRVKRKTITEHQTYTTSLLPGFELPLAKLLALADDWEGEEE